MHTTVCPRWCLQDASHRSMSEYDAATSGRSWHAELERREASIRSYGLYRLPVGLHCSPRPTGRLAVKSRNILLQHVTACRSCMPFYHRRRRTASLELQCLTQSVISFVNVLNCDALHITI